MKEQPPRKGRRRSSSREATDTAYTNTRQPRRARRESNQRKGNAINGIPKGKVKEKKKKNSYGRKGLTACSARWFSGDGDSPSTEDLPGEGARTR